MTRRSAGRPPQPTCVQSRLITLDGARLPDPEFSALGSCEISRGDVDALIDARPIRRESLASGDHLELVHDRLAAVATRRRREAADRVRLAEQGAQQRKRQRTFRLGVFGLLLGLASLALFLGFRSKENRHAKDVAEALVTRSHLAEEHARRAFIQVKEDEIAARRAETQLHSTLQDLEAEKKAVDAALRRTSEAEHATARERDSARLVARDSLAQDAAIEGANMTAGSRLGGSFRGLSMVSAAYSLVRGSPSVAAVVEPRKSS
jgi:hypothetical protein